MTMEGRFVHVYSKYFYISLINCLRYWCNMGRYCPYYFYTGSKECSCFEQYPSIRQAFDGWGNHVMTNVAENQAVKERIRAKMGKASNYFFAQEDRFLWIINNEDIHAQLLAELFRYDWNVKHN